MSNHNTKKAKLYRYTIWHCPRCGTKNGAPIKTKTGDVLPACYHCGNKTTAGEID